MINKLVTKFLILTIIVISSNAQASKNTRIGVVGAANEDVIAKDSNGLERSLKLGDEIYFNDTIVANETGNAQLIFVDKSTITIGSSTTVKIDNFVYNPETSAGSLVVRGAKGTFRFVGGALSKKSAVKFKTPVGTIGIRGGITQVHIDETKGATVAQFLYGKEMTFQNLAGNVERVTQRGIALNVTTPSYVPQIVSFTNEQLSSHINQLTGKDGKSAGAKQIPNDNDVKSLLKTNSHLDIEPEKISSNKGKFTKKILGKRTKTTDSKGNVTKTFTDEGGNIYTTTINTDGSNTESYIGTDGLNYESYTDIDGTTNSIITTPDGGIYEQDDVLDIMKELSDITDVLSDIIVQASNDDVSNDIISNTDINTNNPETQNPANMDNFLNNKNIDKKLYNQSTILHSTNIGKLPWSGTAHYKGNVSGNMIQNGQSLPEIGTVDIELSINDSKFSIAEGMLSINLGQVELVNSNEAVFDDDLAKSLIDLEIFNGDGEGSTNLAVFGDSAQNIGGDYEYDNYDNNTSGTGTYESEHTIDGGGNNNADPI